MEGICELSSKRESAKMKFCVSWSVEISSSQYCASGRARDSGRNARNADKKRRELKMKTIETPTAHISKQTYVYGLQNYDFRKYECKTRKFLLFM